MKPRMHKTIWPILALFLTVMPISAQNFSFSSESMSSITAPGREKTVLKGKAQVLSDSTTITAGEVELYGKNYRYALSRGDVTALDKQKGIILKAQELFFDREKKISRVNGAAILEDQKNEMIVKGGYFENRDKEDLIIIQIGVRILKKDLTCRSEYAKYNRKTEMLELSGMPVVYWKGDEYRADRIKVNVKTNEISLEGRVSGKVIPEDSKPKPDVPVQAAQETAPEDKTVDKLETVPDKPKTDPSTPAALPPGPVAVPATPTPTPPQIEEKAPDGK